MDGPAGVTVDVAGDDGGRLVATLTSTSWVFTVRGTPVELLRLRDVGAARWTDRTSVAAGRCAGAQVHWSTDPTTGLVTALLSSTDDELWDVGLTLPLQAVADLVDLVVAFRP